MGLTAERPHRADVVLAILLLAAVFVRLDLQRELPRRDQLPAAALLLLAPTDRSFVGTMNLIMALINLFVPND